MRKVLILICLLISATNIVNAANWVEITYKAYIDLNSYKREGRYTSAWFKSLNRGDWELIKGKKVWYNISLFKADCTSKTIQILSTADYDLNGKLIDSIDSDIGSRFFQVAPDTVGEIRYNALCN